jgi:hypothetical protein
LALTAQSEPEDELELDVEVLVLLAVALESPEPLELLDPFDVESLELDDVLDELLDPPRLSVL